PDRELGAFASALAFARHPGVVLFDTPKARPHLAAFLQQFGASAVVPVGRFDENDNLIQRLGMAVEPVVRFENGTPRGFSKILFPDAVSVQRAWFAVLGEGGPPRTVLLIHPARDWASLAPWLATQKHAAVVLTNNDGKNVAEVVDAATRRPELRCVDHVILLGDAKAIPTQTRPNPIAGKDPEIEMEPLTPQAGVFSYAVGRLTRPDIAIVPLPL